MAITIRVARAEDAVAATPLIYSSGPSVFDYICKPAGPDRVFSFVEDAFSRGAGELGFQGHVVAVDGNEVVGVGTAFSGGDVGRNMLAGVWHAVSFYGLRGGVGVIRRALHAERVVRPPKGDLHCIAHVGVAQARRSKGIGSLIVQHLLEDGRERGRATAVLDVACDNMRAHDLYVRLGFRVVRECVSNLSNSHATIPNHLRMERRL